MAKIVVTGVAGMIGSHLLDCLMEQGHTVIGVDNLSFGKLENIQHWMESPNFSFFKTDVLYYNEMFELCQGTDIIIHLAAQKKPDEKYPSLRILNTNGQGTGIVFKIASEQGQKVILASSSDVYGMSPDLPFREDGDLLLGPSMIKRWSYATSKLYAEQLAYAYFKDHHVPMVILRYFGGFSQRSSFFWSGGHVPIFIHNILNNREIIIHGNGTQTRSMCHVNDLVAGTLKAMDRECAIGQVINLGSEEEISVIDCAKMIHKIAETSYPLKIKYVPFSELYGQYKDIQRRRPDLSKAKELLDYSPGITLEFAVKQTIDTIKRTQN